MSTGDVAGRRREIETLIDSWPGVPAFLVDRHLTVVASNAAARAVSPSFAVGVNLVRFTFLGPGVDHAAPGWTTASDQVTAILRDSLDQHRADIPFRDIVGELSAMSASFSEAWAEERRPEATGTAGFEHPAVGPFELVYQQLRVPDDDEDILFVWRADGASSAQALRRLLDVRRDPSAR